MAEKLQTSLNYREIGRYILSGLAGSAIGFFTYNLIWWLLPEWQYRESTAWFISYNVAALRQHYLHCRFTFQEMRGQFWSRLPAAYTVYGVGLLITTSCHLLVTQVFGFDRHAAWVACYAVAIATNYPMLKRMVYNAPKPSPV